jgi:hypothetical protein
MLAWRVLLVVFVIAGILWSFRPGMIFYAGGMGVYNRSRPAPKWLGRVWFVLFGLGFIAMGLNNGERFHRILSASFAIFIGVVFLCGGGWSCWMADGSKEGGSHFWRDRIFVLLIGVGFLWGGLILLRH